MKALITIKICRSLEDINKIARVAKIIWHEYYSNILTYEQIDHMLRKFQSEEAIAKAIFSKGYRYYMLLNGNEILGYCGVFAEQNKRRLYLSKFYIKKQSRAKGYSRVMLNEVISYTKELDLDYIYLNVNKNNLQTISIYKRLGFAIIKEKTRDVGGGYKMEDLVMRLLV